MTSLTVYDPPIYRSTGVCGPELDQRLVNIAAHPDWLKAQGAKVRQINPPQEPMEFVTQPIVKALMDATGGDDLPAILVGERILSQGHYPSRAELSAIAEIGGTDTASNVGQVFGVTIVNAITNIPDAPGLAALKIDPEAAAQDCCDRSLGPIRGSLSDKAINGLMPDDAKDDALAAALVAKDTAAGSCRTGPPAGAVRC